MKYDDFIKARGDFTSHDIEAKFALDGNAPGINILWMYPDTLHMHGGKGDLMALARYGMIMGIPVTIRKCAGLKDEIDFDWADIILFESGDLAVMEDVLIRLIPLKDKFLEYIKRGNILMAIGSTGALLAEETKLLDGRRFKGLGLLNMTMIERETIFGDDLWIETELKGTNGEKIELYGAQVQRLDTYLKGNDKPFGRVKYGRGNNGEESDNTEGAISQSGNVIFTNMLGPVFIRNPILGEYIINNAYDRAGFNRDNKKHSLDSDSIALELQGILDMKEFIEGKMK